MDLYCMPNVIEEEIEVVDVGSVTLNSSIKLSVGTRVNFSQPLINSYDEYNTYHTQLLGNHRMLQEIWPKNVSLEEKKEEIIKRLRPDENSHINELIIIDSYLFKEEVDSKYEKIIVEILKELDATKIIVITSTSRKDYNPALYKSINKQLDGIIQVKKSKDYHDRFWIVNKNKGFTLGTSLNGVGNKVTRIDDLEPIEIKDVLESLPEN